MKLLLLSPGECRDKKTWSGTCLALYNSFAKINGVALADINMYKHIPILLKGLYRLYAKYVRRVGNNTRNFIVYPTFTNRIKTIINKSESDWNFFITDYAVSPKIEARKKLAVLVDSEVIAWAKDMENRDFKYFDKKTTEALKRMNLIFTESDWVRNYVIEKRGIDSNKVFTVGCGINLKPYEGEKDYGKKLLLIVLRKGTEEYKGLYLLLDALKIVRKTYPETRLAVVGSDVAQGIEGVDTYYNQPRSVTVELFKQSTLYTMPSKREPNGVTYVEALANKTPIVGLNHFAFPEFTGYGKYGFISEDETPEGLAKVLTDALSNTERLKEMGEKGQEYVMNKYSWDIVCRKICEQMDIYDNSINTEKTNENA